MSTTTQTSYTSRADIVDIFKAVALESVADQAKASAGASLDMRRALEDRIEEERLRRDLQEFDFDI